MLENEKDFKTEAVYRVAQEITIAARTAPKARGMDLLEILTIKGNTIEKISKKMKEIGERESHHTFLRDSENIKQAQAIILIGTKIKHIGLKYCGYCGYKNCAEAEENDAICVFNTGDLGIAIGSAVSKAADFRVDNRIMYTIGVASIELGLMNKEIKVAYGIPLSVSGKNPFFDRK